MILELVNPSDAITFDGDDVTVAGVACLLLGNGWYALNRANGLPFVPMMILGSHKDWLKEHGIEDLDEWIEKNSAALADFLGTVAYGSIAEREAFDEAVKRMTPEKAEEHRTWWNNKNRSSCNNIGKAALKMAENLRNLAAKGECEPLKASPPIVLVGPR